MKEIYKIAKLISKEKVGDLTVDEQQELAEWKLKNERTYRQASDSKQIQKKHELYAKIDQEENWKKITNDIPELKTKVIRLRTVLKWAAVIMLPLLVTTYMLNEVYWTKDSAIVEAGSSKATLELSNGKTIYLEDYQGKDITSGKEKLASNANNELVYQQGDAVEKVLKYNTIKTPIQGEYYMQLSDGTRIWLNAQTEIQFPEKFGKGKREVKLISGEAYFAVAKEKERPFDVYLNDGSKVEVLGTEFNVMAYQDESEIQTTLVEGSVQFSKESEEVILVPGEQVGMNLDSNKMEVREVKTSIYTAWKDGKFVFNREPMESVLRKMSRWYGVKVICDDESVLKRRISGVTDRYEDIDKLINLIEEISPIELELEDDHLLVSRKVE